MCVLSLSLSHTHTHSHPDTFCAHSILSCIASCRRRKAIRTNGVLRAGGAVVFGDIEKARCAIFAFVDIGADIAAHDEFLSCRTRLGRYAA